MVRMRVTNNMKRINDFGTAYLQLLQPVLTFGLLVRNRLGRSCGVSPDGKAAAREALVVLIMISPRVQSLRDKRSTTVFITSFALGELI